MAVPEERSGGRLWYLGLGSNVGDRERMLREALQRLDSTRGTRVVAASRIYETDAWGEMQQPPFLNMVARARSSLGPADLLREAKRIECELGRRPTNRWGPREIDIDLLVSGDLRVNTHELTIPHPLISQRQFVLVPLADLDPGLQLGDGSTVAEHVVHDGSVRLWHGQA